MVKEGPRNRTGCWLLVGWADGWAQVVGGRGEKEIRREGEGERDRWRDAWPGAGWPLPWHLNASSKRLLLPLALCHSGCHCHCHCSQPSMPMINPLAVLSLPLLLPLFRFVSLFSPIIHSCLSRPVPTSSLLSHFICAIIIVVVEEVQPLPSSTSTCLFSPWRCLQQFARPRDPPCVLLPTSAQNPTPSTQRASKEPEPKKPAAATKPQPPSLYPRPRSLFQNLNPSQSSRSSR